VSPATPTHPPNHRGMWRRLIGRAHPDAGGAHDLFIWAVAVRDVMCGLTLPAGGKAEPEDHPSRRREASTHDEPARVPFDPFADLEVLTDRALTMAEAVAEPYGYLLRQVADCRPHPWGSLHDQQRQGGSYKSLAAIGHRVGMTKPERVQWYSVAGAIPLSQRHAGHILSKLQKAAA
jgi:hypothetical protein